MRKKSINPETIIKTAIAISAELGLENISTKRISIDSSIAEGSLFNYFKTKKELIIACIKFVDQELAAELLSADVKGLNLQNTTKTLWRHILEYLISNPNVTLFYLQAINSAFYTQEVISAANMTINTFKGILHKKSVEELSISHEIVFKFTLYTALIFASDSIKNSTNISKKDIESFTNLTFYGLSDI